MAGRVDLADLPFRVFAALFLALFALACAPLLLTPLPPLVDYPNHLARMYLLATLDRLPALQQYYAIAWRPVPDLAMDAVVPPLLRILPLEWAGKLFVAVTFFMLAAGAVALNRVTFRRWSAWPCLAFLLLYNRLLLWGFLNFLFGLGLALLAFAAWIVLQRRAAALRAVLGLVMALTVYFAHLMAFGVYGALVLGHAAGEACRGRCLRDAGREITVAVLTLLPGVALFVLTFVVLHPAAQPAFNVHFAQPGRKLDLLFSVFDDYSRPVDVACFAAAVLGMALAYWRGWASLAPEIVVPFFFLLLLYIVMPSMLFGASGADRRLPLVLAMVLIGGSVWRAPSTPIRRAFFGAAAALFVFRLALVATSWHASGRLYAGLISGLDALPRGARLAVAYPSAELNVEAAPLAHFALLAVPRRDAFVPTLFAYVSQQPIAFTPQALPLLDGFSADGLWEHFVEGRAYADPRIPAALARYDYIAFAGKQPFELRSGGGLQPVFISPRFGIYRLPGRTS
jgi:hypothetical protein